MVAVLPIELHAQTTVSISGRDVLLNGKKFFGRGVAYGITPIGQWSDSKKGCCTWDWYSSPEVWQRDMPYLQELNVNLIRVYNWRSNVNHNDFLDECYRRGIYVVAAFQWKWSDYNSGAAGRTRMRNNLINMINLHKNHPAIVMWTIGNELNLSGGGHNVEVWNFVEELKNLLHTTEAPHWRPVSSPLADGSSMWSIIEKESTAVDLWMAQLYKGQSFYDFWTRYKAASGKPMMITEFGVDSYVSGKSTAEGEKLQGEWEMAMWNEMMQHTDILSGALKFAYVDGWFKCQGGSVDSQETCPSDAGNRFPGGQINEEYFGMVAFVSSTPAPLYNDAIRVKGSYCKWKNAWKNLPRYTNLTIPYVSGCPLAVDPIQVYSEADSYVRAGMYANTAYGSEGILSVKYAASEDVLRESFLRFDLSSLPSDLQVSNATMVLTVSTIDRNNDFTFNLERVSDNSWQEASITYNSKPTTTQFVKNVLRPQGVNLLRIDVTQQVQQSMAQKKISFWLRKESGSDERLEFYSKEAAGISTRPRLEIIASSGAGVPQTTQSSAGPPSDSTSSSSTTGFDTQPDDTLNSNDMKGSDTNGSSTSIYSASLLIIVFVSVWALV